MLRRKEFATLAVHIGSEPDFNSGAVVAPISLATTFSQAHVGNLSGTNDANSWGLGYEYSRTGNPTRGAFERCMAAVEYASGLAATTAIMNLFSSGDHIICIDDVYGGTQRLFRKVFGEQYKLEFTFLSMDDMNELENSFKPNTKLVWLETPTNPTLKIADIAAISAVTKMHNALLCVDNTFMTPYLQNPILLGADMVIHSVTKYIGGHSDVVMGVIILNDEALFKRIRFIQNAAGYVPSPFDSYMALRGLKTLHVRMKEAMKNAQEIAEFLEQHPKVEKVIYPGLRSHPQYELCKNQSKGPGAMITFFLKGGIDESKSFLANLKLFTLAESLGAVESLAECPAVMTHASVSQENRQLLGISDNLIRLSIGIEHCSDLIEDLKNALSII